MSIIPPTTVPATPTNMIEIAAAPEEVRLRIQWMLEMGYGWEAITSSLKHNRPQSVEEERYVLELARRCLETERALGRL